MSTKIASLYAEIGADTSGVKKGLGETKTGLAQTKSAMGELGLGGVAAFLSIGGAIAGTAKLLGDALQETQNYANEVRDLSRISGESAENTSRFIQVLDDYQLTAQDAETATRALTKNGLAPNIETLAKLADGYIALNTPEEKNAYIMKNLGRAGLEWANVLNQGGDALRKQSAEVEKSLIWDQKKLDAAEKLRLSQDKLNDTYQGLQVTVGTAMVPALTRELDIINDLLSAENLWAGLGERVSKGKIEQRDAIYAAMDALNAHADALAGDTKATAGLLGAEEDLTNVFKGQLDLYGTIQSETDSYTEKQDALKNKMGEVQGEIDNLIKQGWWPMSEKVQGLQGDLQNLSGEYDANAAAHEKATGKILYDLEMQAFMMDGKLTPAEKAMAEQMGITLGVFDAASVAMAQDMQDVADAVDAGRIPIDKMKEVLDAMAKGYTIDIAIQISESDLSLITTLGGGTAISKGLSRKASGGSASGMTWVGEQGPELLSLPGGSYVHSNRDSMAMAGGVTWMGDVIYNASMDGADERAVAQRLRPAILQVMREFGVA